MLNEERGTHQLTDASYSQLHRSFPLDTTADALNFNFDWDQPTIPLFRLCETNQHLVNGVCLSSPHLHTFDPTATDTFEPLCQTCLTTILAPMLLTKSGSGQTSLTNTQSSSTTKVTPHTTLSSRLSSQQECWSSVVQPLETPTCPRLSAPRNKLGSMLESLSQEERPSTSFSMDLLPLILGAPSPLQSRPLSILDSNLGLLVLSSEDK